LLRECSRILSGNGSGDGQVYDPAASRVKRQAALRALRERDQRAGDDRFRREVVRPVERRLAPRLAEAVDAERYGRGAEAAAHERERVRGAVDVSAPSVQSASSRSRLGSPAACSHFTTSANGIRFMLTIVQFFNYNPKNGL